MLKHLRRGGCSIVLPDQVPGLGDGEWVDFFGRPAYTMTLVGRLQEACDAALVFCFALLGVMVERERFATLSHLTLFPIFLAMVSLPLWIEPRYGLPMMPLVAILSAVGFTRTLKFQSKP